MTGALGGLILLLKMENATAEPAMPGLIFAILHSERRAQPALCPGDAAGRSGPQKFRRSKTL